MKEKTIIADRLMPFRLTDIEYIEILSRHIEDIDDALMKAVAIMDKAFLDVEEIDHHVLFLNQKWKEFKSSIGAQ